MMDSDCLDLYFSNYFALFFQTYDTVVVHFQPRYAKNKEEARDSKREN